MPIKARIKSRIEAPFRFTFCTKPAMSKATTSWKNMYWPSVTCVTKDLKVVKSVATLSWEPKILAKVKTIFAVPATTQSMADQNAALRSRKDWAERLPCSSSNRKEMARRIPTTAILAVIVTNLLIVVRAFTNGPELGRDAASRIIFS